MRLPLWVFAGWYVLFNIIGMCVTMTDKERARHDRTRIPERQLMFIGFLGGAPMMWVTMLLIRHKTRRVKFMVAMPLLTLAHVALFYYLWTSPFIMWLY